MIPKIIHFCWLSNDPYPENIKRYMDTWISLLPEYEFIHWNFDRFPHGSSKWVDEAFYNKKYAFAADYIRLYALYNYGGIYLDTDVEVLKSFNDLIDRRELIGVDSAGFLEVASFGAEKHNKWIGLCLKEYENKSFVNKDGTFQLTPLPRVIDDILKRNGFTVHVMDDMNDSIVDDTIINALPCEYFGAKSYATGNVSCTPNTYSIHHFAGSWLDEQSIWIHNQSKKFNRIPFANLVIVFIGYLKFQGLFLAIRKLYNWYLSKRPILPIVF